MKLLRVGPQGHERPAILLDEATYLDLSSEVDDFNEEFFASDGLKRLPAVVDRLRATVDPSPLSKVRIGAPITRPHQILCIGLNYSDHAAETGQAVPTEPIIFNKSPNTLIGPNDDVVIPRGSTKTDWEVELGVVIGQRARYVASPEDAASFIAGYCVSHDVSEREWQLERGSQWDRGKSCETFNPLGPWLVTADEVPDVQQLSLWLSVNGTVRQRGSTRDMVFGAAYLVWYLSQFMVLEPGDLINTGTPAGVSLGHDDVPYLRAGDVVELSIDGFGTQRSVLRPA